jgi:uncharacterized protein
MHEIAQVAANFIHLDIANITYLFFVGFVGGLVSGFIGSGGAFVLTPAMMSLGVPGLVAVASNMCHKFPKALIGSIKRAKYGQVDVKLGIVLGISAEAGVLYGAHIQEGIKRTFGEAGSNLYVSSAFVVILAVVGGFVLFDAWKTYRSGNSNEEEKVTKIARWVQSVNIPGTMVYFKSLNARVSVLFTIPLGFATGMLAATIAVGGFVGVPSMIYVLGAPSLMASATELVIAFVMGQLGAMGTTYVKPFMIKMVMGVIMVIVLFSRGLMVPVYLSQLGLIETLSESTTSIMKSTSFGIMVTALVLGAFIVLRAMWQGRSEERKALAAEEALSHRKI